MKLKKQKSNLTRWIFIGIALVVFLIIRYIPVSSDLRGYGGAELTHMGQTALGNSHFHPCSLDDRGTPFPFNRTFRDSYDGCLSGRTALKILFK